MRENRKNSNEELKEELIDIAILNLLDILNLRTIFIKDVLTGLEQERLKNGIFKQAFDRIIEDNINEFLKLANVLIIIKYERFSKDFFSTIRRMKIRPSFDIDTNIDKVKKMLKDSFDIEIESSFKNWESIRENYYRRHVIVHRNSKIDKDYLKKKLNLKVENGLEIKNDLRYIERCIENFISFVEYILKKFTKICEITDASDLIYNKILNNHLDLDAKYYQKLLKIN
jgi:hypothetical protein